MDPQQRLLLERGYEALHGAAMRKASLQGSLCGVFLGVWTPEFNDVLARSPAALSVYSATAAMCSVAAGRVSFVLGLQGPCLSYDTACSSSLAASTTPRKASWKSMSPMPRPSQRPGMPCEKRALGRIDRSLPAELHPGDISEL